MRLLAVYLSACYPEEIGKVPRIKPQGHTIPPVIIKSVDDPNIPIDFETRGDLVGVFAFFDNQTNSTYNFSKFYRIGSFKLAQHVRVQRKTAGTGISITHEYESEDGFIVQIFLQSWTGNQWEDENGGAHIIMRGKNTGFSFGL